MILRKQQKNLNYAFVPLNENHFYFYVIFTHHYFSFFRCHYLFVFHSLTFTTQQLHSTFDEFKSIA